MIKIYLQLEKYFLNKQKDISTTILKCHKSPFVQMTNLFASDEKPLRKEITLELRNNFQNIK